MIELKNNPAGNFFLLAGPCVIEGEEMAMRIAERVVKITETLQIPYVFKGSYRKANRSRLDSFMGIGDEKALKILQKVRSQQLKQERQLTSKKGSSFLLWLCSLPPTKWWKLATKT